MGLRDLAEGWREARRHGAMSFGPEIPPPPASNLVLAPGVADLISIDGDSASLGNLYVYQWAVRVCADFLSTNTAQTKLKSYLRGENSREELRYGEHPLPTILQRPNEIYSGFDLMLATVDDLAIYDDAFWYKAFVGSKRALFRLPPAYVNARGGSILTGPKVYDVQIGAGRTEIDPARMVHFHGYNPFDTRTGSSRLNALRTVVNEETQASRSRRAFLRNAGQQSGWIKRPRESGALSEAALDRLRKDVNAKWAGPENAGTIGILEEDMDFVPNAFSPRQSEFIEGREFALDAVATAYGIPLALLSRKNTATFASMREFHKMLYVDVMGPWHSLIENAIWMQLIPDFGDPGDLQVVFDIEEKLQGDFEAAADAFRAHVQVPDWSVNDARRQQDKPPYGDPTDPANPFNWPAKPSNYSYGGPAAGPPPTVVPNEAAPTVANGHAELADEDLREILETR